MAGSDWSAGLRIECLRTGLPVSGLIGCPSLDRRLWQNVLGLWIVRSSLSVEWVFLDQSQGQLVVEYEDYTFPVGLLLNSSGSTPFGHSRQRSLEVRKWEP